MPVIGVAMPSLTVSPRPSGGGGTSFDVFKFSGAMAGTLVALRIRFAGDTPNASYISPVNYPASRASANATLRVKPTANTLTVATTFEVFVNGAGTGLLVVIPAGSVAIATAALAVAIVAGDLIDLRMSLTGGGLLNFITAASTVEFI